MKAFSVLFICINKSKILPCGKEKLYNNFFFLSGYSFTHQEKAELELEIFI